MASWDPVVAGKLLSYDALWAGTNQAAAPSRSTAKSPGKEDFVFQVQAWAICHRYEHLLKLFLYNNINKS